ncbi:hypothetical protein GCM10010912_17540 [Paenibacillus albidus]|uniref:Uncharacterized protein n=1 Tax=Paenibacillus albidus TaxID=2041023 RepID=A0A917FFG6_9BACL|nr:hypothetical protein [Paenibacillus albidus]GGF72812.1 hypothetical protein GCM10010912_17540 [Paenibacillus albidus]
MANKIQIKRGTIAQIKAAPRDIAELVYATDTKDLYIGNASGGDTLFLAADNIPYNVNRQAIINGGFEVAQRGATFTNPSYGTYTLDRYRMEAGGVGTFPTSIVHSQATLVAGAIPGGANYYNVSVNGAGSGYGTDAYYLITQLIERGTRYLCGAGKKLVLSFWAFSSISGKKIAVNIAQSYGTGGSPSATEQLIGQAITLTAGWARYTVVFDTQTLVGKTFGSNGDDSLGIRFWLMWGANFSSRFGASTSETFLAAGNIGIAQVQLSTADVPFQPRTYHEELSLCRRYFSKSRYEFVYSYVDQVYTALASWPQRMRVNPTVTIGTLQGVYDTALGVTATAGIKDADGLRTINLSALPYLNQSIRAEVSADAEL